MSKKKRDKSNASTSGERMRIFRKSHGLTQEKFAELIGVDVVTVCNWERGFVYPGGYALESIKNVFGSAALIFIYGNEEKTWKK